MESASWEAPSKDWIKCGAGIGPAGLGLAWLDPYRSYAVPKASEPAITRSGGRPSARWDELFRNHMVLDQSMSWVLPLVPVEIFSAYFRLAADPFLESQSQRPISPFLQLRRSQLLDCFRIANHTEVVARRLKYNDQ